MHIPCHAAPLSPPLCNEGPARGWQASVALSEILRAVEQTVHQATRTASPAQAMSLAARTVTDGMHASSAVVEENTAATKEMAAQSGQVASAIQTIATVSAEQHAATVAVAAGADEMRVQVEAMTSEAQELAATAEGLETL